MHLGGTWSLEDSSWCLHSQPGLILSLTGTLLVATVRGSTIVSKGKSKGLEQLLSQLSKKKGENSFDSENLYVVERGVGLFVPCGSVAFVFALHENRVTKQKPEEAGQSKKRRRKAQQDYASHVWVPCMSELDAKVHDAKVISWAFSQLTVSQSQMKKAYKDSSGFSAWMDSLNNVAKEQSKKKEEEPQEKKDDSSSDDDIER
jgi:hypothetical protein